jgi:GLPGLI family protein
MKYLLFFTLLFSIFLHSQNIARINYIVSPSGGSLEKNEDVKKSKIASMFIGVDEELKKLNYELLINDNKSYYHLISNLDFNERASRLARSFANPNDFYYDSLKNEFIKVTDLSGQTFNIRLNQNTNWNLTNETKVINGYTCFKATKEKYFRLKKTSIIVTAWYCPSIPLNYGPKEFGGLPGLIIELIDGKITYLADKVEINNNLKIKFKEINGSIISEEEFNIIYDKSVHTAANTISGQ